MMHDWVPHLLTTTRHITVLLSLRVLPFAVYGAVRSGAPLRRRLLWIVAYVFLPWLACYVGGGRAILLLAGGLAYYLIISLGVGPLRELMATKRLGRGGLLLVLYLGYLLLPGVVVPEESLSTFLVVGCELALSEFQLLRRNVAR